MKIENAKPIIEAILFAAGNPVEISDIAMILEWNPEDVQKVMEEMRIELSENNRGIEMIKVNHAYQLCTKKEYYDYIYPLLDKRGKPNLSNAALETLSIIAYNPKITRAEIEQLRGVSSDATIYKLLEYNLIEDAGKADLPGKPMTYQTTDEFLRLFGVSSLEQLPELPRIKIDENEQIVIEDIENQQRGENNNE